MSPKLICGLALSGLLLFSPSAWAAGASSQTKASMARNVPQINFTGVTLKASYVAPDKDEVTLTLSVTTDASVGFQQNLIVSGLMKTGKESILRYAPAIPFKVVAKK